MKVKISKKSIPVDKRTNTAQIDVEDAGKVYIVQGDGAVVQYPLPAFGVLEISSQNYKIGKPKYHISAD